MAIYSKHFQANGSPGRFFAVTMLKLLLGFILCGYDVTTTDGSRPEDTTFMTFIIPDTKAELLFRKRVWLL
jgi:hypothetical protein